MSSPLCLSLLPGLGVSPRRGGQRFPAAPGTFGERLWVGRKGWPHSGTMAAVACWLAISSHNLTEALFLAQPSSELLVSGHLPDFITTLCQVCEPLIAFQ